MFLQIVKVFNEDGMGKVVEIPADMTAKDLCQLLVYKSHCVDDNSWVLVEHHPLLGLGKRVGTLCLTTAHMNKCTQTHSWASWGVPTCSTVTDTHTGVLTCMYAHIQARILAHTVLLHALTQAFMQVLAHAPSHYVQ